MYTPQCSLRRLSCSRHLDHILYHPCTIIASDVASEIAAIVVFSYIVSSQCYVHNAVAFHIAPLAESLPADGIVYSGCRVSIAPAGQDILSVVNCRPRIHTIYCGMLSNG